MKTVWLKTVPVLALASGLLYADVTMEPKTEPAVESEQPAKPVKKHKAKKKAKAEKKAEMYHCPMHPEVQQNTPGRCPKCGMDLEKMK